MELILIKYMASRQVITKKIITMTLITEKYLTKGLFVALVFILLGGFSFSSYASADFQTPPAVALCDMSIKAAGIPIDGLAADDSPSWHVVRIDFQPTATDDQKAAAWEIVRNFDYQKALATYEDYKPVDTVPVTTNFSTTAPTLTQDGQISVAQVNGYPYIYFQANGVTQHILGASSFEISSSETTDAISGEKMQVGDFVIGMIDQNLNNADTPDNSSLHGIWVKWSSVKKELIEELKDSNALSADGVSGSGKVSGVNSSSFLDSIINVLASLGIYIKDGIVNIISLAVDKLVVNTAIINKIEMIDQSTGQIYCTWIENGEWQKSEGSCDEVSTSSQNVVLPKDTGVNAVDNTKSDATNLQTTSDTTTSDTTTSDTTTSDTTTSDTTTSDTTTSDTTTSDTTTSDTREASLEDSTTLDQNITPNTIDDENIIPDATSTNESTTDILDEPAPDTMFDITPSSDSAPVSDIVPTSAPVPVSEADQAPVSDTVAIDKTNS